MKKRIIRTIVFAGKQTFLGLLLQCILWHMVSAVPLNAQDIYKVTISISIKDATLSEIFEKIEDMTDYTFAFNKQLIEGKDLKITIDYANKSVGYILEEIGKKQGLKFRQINKVISIQEADQSSRKKPEPDITVSGKVIDAENGENLVGVNVLLKGSAAGTITDINGDYNIAVPDANAVLLFSYIGYVPQEITVGSATTINVQMAGDSRQLSEVVVTAFGLEREKKRLGYSVQEVEGSRINEAREGNMVMSLAGKVAGVNIIGNSTVGGSSRIIIRGESSLDINKNQPLFIVDGVPISNDIINTKGADYGNAAGEMNPDDIKSISILKGPSASALYGSRAANGVVLITTKSGKNTRGIGISVNSGISFQTPLILPKFQNKFGQGDNGKFEGSNFGYDGIYPNDPTGGDSFDESWGPRLDAGDDRAQFDSPTQNGYRGGDVHVLNRGEIIPTPWVSQPDNVRDFFETGSLLNNNVALTGGGDRGDFRLSYTNMDQKGIVPNNDLQRNTIALNTNFKLTSKLSVNSSVNYIKTESTNRPVQGYGTETPMYFFTWMGRQVNINSLKDYWQPGLKGIQQYNFNYNYHNNPYFLQYENTNGQLKDRILGNISLTYAFNPNLTLMVRSGMDLYSDLRPSRAAFSTQGAATGSYSEAKIYFEERNTDFLLSYTKELNTDWSITASFGGNQMIQQQKFNETTAPQLLIPGIYNFGNKAAELQISQYDQRKRINSFYAIGQVAYKNMLFLDVTTRNDWSSTLPADSRSYAYPSVTFSGIISDMVNLPGAISLAKLRLGWAQVGNDTDPYALKNTFSYEQPWGSFAGVSAPGSLKNANLKPETVSSYEIGTDLRFFKNRLKLDVTYYDIRSRDQILPVPIAETSGFTERVINAGEIKNQGIEVVLGATPVDMPSGFQWNINVNFSRNRSEVLELAEGIEAYNQSKPGEDAFIQARVGERMGAIYGPGFQRAPDGQIIIGSDGNPVKTVDLIYLGNCNPDWMAGVYNSFFFKGITIGALFDIRQGGIFISRFLNKGIGAGQLIESAALREDRSVGTEYDESDYFHEGVNLNEDGTYTPNRYGTAIRDYHKRYYDHNSEAQSLDASYVKFRELKIGYSLPAKLLSRTPFRSLNFSIVGRNLALWTENQHFDPETPATGSDGLLPGFENMSIPSMKSWGFNLNFTL